MARPLVLLSLVAALAWQVELPEELQELVRKQNEKMAKYNSLKANLQPGGDGLVPKSEYGELLKAVLIPSDHRVHSSTRTLIDDYVKTLPERMNPEGVLTDISSGAFSQLMARKLESDLHSSHDDIL